MATTVDKKKYNYMENTLQNIQSNHISLSSAEVKRNNAILEEVLKKITDAMQKEDDLFKALFRRVFYGGSYYDGLRVGSPEEYDLDLLLQLPKLTAPVLSTENIPGFVNLQLKGFQQFQKQPQASTTHRKLVKLLDDKHYLITSKVLSWMEGVVTTTLNHFPKVGSESVIQTSQGTFYGKVCKGGPAFTLKMHGKVNGVEVIMDIDLVPCFVFGADKWPQGGYRLNPVTTKPEFFIVPKAPKSVPCSGTAGRYWRLSFQEQERVLISGNKNNLKPSVKLLKKMRDNLVHVSIASYYIKTMFLWEVMEQNDAFWNSPLSYVFMHMLKRYLKFLEDGKIPYFWNKKNNLIGSINSSTLNNMKMRLKRIIDDIDKHPNEPLFIVKYFE